MGVAAVIGVLALVGVFDGGGGTGNGRAALPSVPTARAAGGNWLNRIYEQASPSVLFVQATIVRPQTSPFGQRQQGGATGTGFVTDDQGRVLTNAHVVENARQVQIRTKDNSLVDAQVIGTDVSDDLALLKVDPSRLPGAVKPLLLGDSDTVRPGDPVAAMGNPLGLRGTITSGIVSATQRRITAPDGFTIDGVLQTDAAVNPGNSGGPLIDGEGKVIGINSQIATAPSPQGGASTAEGFIGIAFAIPINTAKKVIPDLEDDGRVQRPYLGVSTVTLGSQLAGRLGIKTQHGALVITVAQGSPAERAGLRGSSPGDTGAITQPGDVIVGVGGTDVTSSDDLGAAIAGAKPGQTVELHIVRGGDERTVEVQLAARPTATGG